MENAGECNARNTGNAIKSKISYDCRFYCSVERSTLEPITYDYPEWILYVTWGGIIEHTFI